MNKIRYYSNFVMIAVYLGLGLLFFFTNIAEETVTTYRKELGATMMIYAVIRTLLVIRKQKRENRNEF